MPAPKKYGDELRERATRLALDARRDPATSTGAIKRVADQLGIHPEALRTWVRPLMMLQAEADHRRHAIIEQVIAELKNGPLAHLPSGNFNANAAWLVLSAMAFNLTRAAGTLTSLFHAKATTATIRAQLINVPARVVRSARRIRLRLPTHWPWADTWLDLFTAANAPPPAAT